MRSIWHDVRYGVRSFSKQPGFAMVAILTLALGIGANTAIFSIVNAVLLNPLPYPQPDSLIKIYETFLPEGYGSVSVPNLKDWREQNDVFEGIAAYFYRNYNLQASDQPARVRAARVTSEFFDLIGVAPQIGRTFLPGEDQDGSARVVVLSDALWRSAFNADPQIINREIVLSGETHTVIGVMPPEFSFPGRGIELWTPLVFTQNQITARGNHSFQTIARLKPGVTRQQAEQQMRAIARRIEEQYPDQQTGRSVLLVPVPEEAVQNVRPALLIMLGTVGFVLLIACTNVANLLLARAARRRKEIAIRSAIGAGRGRLVRQLLTESVMLGLAGGALGVGIGWLGLKALLVYAGPFLPRATEVILDGRVLAFTLAISILTGIIFGLAPALQIVRSDVQGVLKEEGNAGSSARRSWLRNALVVTEVAAALVLLVGAGLLIQSFARLRQTDSGMRTENVLTFSLAPPRAKYETQTAAAGFYTQALERISGLQGVQSVGLINLLPVQQWGTNSDIEVEGRPPFQPGEYPVVEFRTVSPDYFNSLGIPLIAGRYFGPEDQEQSTQTVIINQSLARTYFPNEDPLGRRISTGFKEGFLTIVGVVGDVRQSGLDQAPRDELYVPHTQAPAGILLSNMTMTVRAAGDPTLLTSAIRNQILSLDPAQPIFNVKTMEEVISDSVADSRLNTLLLTIFATLATVLASIGIYSVMSYTVRQQTREIGIRMALGARTGDVLRLAVGHAMALALVGIIIGAAGAFALTRWMSSLLYEVQATDPMTFVSVAVLLIGVALLACLLPARRASKVDPMRALRYE